MIDGLLRGLQEAKSPRRMWRYRFQAEALLTPREAKALLDLADSLPPSIQDWFARHAPAWQFATSEPQPYEREALDPQVHLFRLPALPIQNKRLIIAFSGGHNRLMVPTPTFLQCLPAKTFDVALVKDPSKGHFLNGAGSTSDSFVGLARWLADTLRPSRYESLICYGDSMGGFSALRFGLMLRASRAVAVSGRFPFHVTRLIGADERPLPAFDCLCRCFQRADTALVAAYASGCCADRRHAKRLTKTVAADRIVFQGQSAHVPLAHLAPADLHAFYSLIFAPGSGPVADVRGGPWAILRHDVGSRRRQRSWRHASRAAKAEGRRASPKVDIPAQLLGD